MGLDKEWEVEGMGVSLVLGRWEVESGDRGKGQSSWLERFHAARCLDDLHRP